MIYYDLSELYLLSFGQLKFYGIARVVAEIAYDVHRLAPDTVFVVYDESRRTFLRIRPTFGAAGDNGLISTGLPANFIPKPLRPHKSTRKLAGRLMASVRNSITRTANHLKHPTLPEGVERIDIKDGVLFSASRPQLLAQMIRYLQKTHSSVHLHALLHDAIPLHEFDGTPSLMAQDFRHNTALVISFAKQIIANSQFTAIDLERFSHAGLLPTIRQMQVVPLAQETRGGASSPATITIPDRPYVVGVGVTLGRKNLDVILRAQEIMVARGEQPPLMIYGGAIRGSMMRALRSGKWTTVHDHVHLLESPSQPDLNCLITYATAAVIPSKLEGWGLPVGEALWLGTPAVVANSSSLPEVGGDLALYFDAESPDELAEIFSRLINDSAYSTTIRERIKDRHHTLRTWSNVAGDLLAALANRSPESSVGPLATAAPLWSPFDHIGSQEASRLRQG
jgi:glycosyltransferase involved in cell wall biosynthesis